MSTVIKQQDEIAVFVNENNGVTIKQTNSHGEDSVIYFWAEHAEALVHAIERVALEAEEASQWERIQSEKAMKRLAGSDEDAA